MHHLKFTDNTCIYIPISAIRKKTGEGIMQYRFASRPSRAPKSVLGELFRVSALPLDNDGLNLDLFEDRVNKNR